MKLLAQFGMLRLRAGMVLRALQFTAGGNGNGKVIAMPANAPFPAPGESVPEGFLPEGAVENPMEQVEGDGTLLAYFWASLLALELAEFGARWHGCWWSTHKFLGDDLTVDSKYILGPSRPERAGEERWTWKGRAPKTWEPTVRATAENVVVTFHSYSELGREAIYRHRAVYRRDSMVAQGHMKTLAQGQGGYIF